MATSSKEILAVHVLKEFYGDCVADVGECLMRKGLASIREIITATGVSSSKVRKALQILIQHGVVKFHQNKHGITEYIINVNQVIYRLHLPRVVQCAGHLYGDVAEMLVEDLIMKGRLPASTIIATVTEQVNESLKAQGAQEVQPSLVRDKLERLAKTRFIKRCSVPVRDAIGKVVSLADPPEHLMFAIPPKDQEGRAGTKRSSSQDQGPPAKMSRLDTGQSASTAGRDETTVYLEVNYPRFLLYFRDQAIGDAVSSRLDSKEAAEVVRTILRHCERTTSPTDDISKPVSFHEIQAEIPRDLGISTHMLDQLLKMLTENMPEFVTKTAESGGGLYCINTFKALEAICFAHIESTVQERFGSKSLRIFRIISLKKNVEQMTIEKCVLMPSKDVKEQLYRMFIEHFVQVTELAKTPDHAPSRTFYLFNVDVYKITRMLLDNIYKMIKNVRIKRQLVSVENRRLLDKEERVEAVLSSMNPQLAAMEEEERQQVTASIEDSITPSERQQLKETKGINRHLEASEQQLVSILALMEDYVAFTYKPPAPKRQKEFLD